MAKTDWKDNGTPNFNANRHGADKKATFYITKDAARTKKKGEFAELPARSKTDAQVIRGYRPYFVDASDAQANAGFVVSFQHVPSESDVTFKAFITAFNETFNSDWASETVFGRSDPIYMFKNTAREITLALNIPASTVGEAFDNLNRVQELTRFLYPTYDAYAETAAIKGANQPDSINALTITNSPLVRLRVMNLLAARPQIGDADGTKASDGASAGRPNEKIVYSRLGTLENMIQNPGSETKWGTSAVGSNTIADNYHGGLLGVIKNLSINHNLDNPDHGVFQLANGTILPKMIEINLSFGAIHEHTVGWVPASAKGGKGAAQTFSNGLFPYGINPTVKDPADDSGLPVTMAGAAEKNEGNLKALNDTIDKLQDNAIETEQMKMQAEARYAGMFGKMRKASDIRRRDRKRIKSNILDRRGDRLIAEGKTGRAARAESRSDRKAERADELAAFTQDFVD